MSFFSYGRTATLVRPMKFLWKHGWLVQLDRPRLKLFMVMGALQPLDDESLSS
jgi:hypothetical protein